MNWKTTLTPRRFLKGLTGLVSLALLVALAFSLNALFTSRSQKTRQTAGQPQPPAPQLFSPTPTTAPHQADPTEGWKVYSSASHGYSIKYPPTWTLRRTPNEVFSSPDLKVTDGGTVVGGGEIVIFVSKNLSNKPLSDIYANTLNSDFRIIAREEAVIGDLPSLRYEAMGAGIDGTMSGAMVATKSKLYRIEAYYGQQDRDRIVQVLELMLRNMEFTTK